MRRTVFQIKAGKTSFQIRVCGEYAPRKMRNKNNAFAARRKGRGFCFNVSVGKRRFSSEVIAEPAYCQSAAVDVCKGKIAAVFRGAHHHHGLVLDIRGIGVDRAAEHRGSSGAVKNFVVAEKPSAQYGSRGIAGASGNGGIVADALDLSAAKLEVEVTDKGVTQVDIATVLNSSNYTPSSDITLPNGFTLRYLNGKLSARKQSGTTIIVR